MKKMHPRFMQVVLCASLAMVMAASPALALDACQTDCQTRFPVEHQWKTPPPAGMSMDVYRQQVLANLDSLNACFAACAQSGTTGSTGGTTTGGDTGGTTTGGDTGGTTTGGDTGGTTTPSKPSRRK